VPYGYTTLGTALQEVSNRLYDSTQQFWTQAELALFFNEALRTWNAMTGFWRSDSVFPAVSDTTWYDYPSQPNTLRPYTVTDAQLYTLLQYHLLEPTPTPPLPWTGVSAQFTADDLISAVQRRRDELFSVTGCTITRRTVPAIAGRIVLPDTVIDIRRVAYLPNFPQCQGYGCGAYGMGPYGISVPSLVGASNSILWPEDTWGEQSFDPTYTLNPAGIPMRYLQSTQPPLTFDTDRAPAWGGFYELLTIEAGPLLSATTPTLLGIPDDWTPILKWGALADLLSRESNAKDLPRAQYCEARYRMGLKLMLDSPAVLATRLANVPLQIDSVWAADLYNTTWQGQANQKPNTMLHAGQNMLALAPTPDSAYSITATVVQNAPLPVAMSDPIQVPREDLDAIIDYTQHLSSVKMGGQEFLSTMLLFQRFLKQATVYNSKLSELAEFTNPLFGLSSRDAQMHPRFASDEAVTEASGG
jgi:hypothetical protein